jgi:hypothetical protein
MITAMKKFTCTFFVIFAVSCTSFQDFSVIKKTAAKDTTSSSTSLAKEYYLIQNKNGELYIHHNNEIIPIKEKSLIMDEGIIITPTGRVYLSDGSRFQMKQNKKMYLNGEKAGEMEIIADK